MENKYRIYEFELGGDTYWSGSVFAVCAQSVEEANELAKIRHLYCGTGVEPYFLKDVRDDNSNLQEKRIRNDLQRYYRISFNLCIILLIGSCFD